MPLIECPDCGHEVSDRAPACPKCGCPIAATVTEQTGKGYKASMLVCLGLLVVGIVLYVGSRDVPLWGGTAKALIPWGEAPGFGLMFGGVMGLVLCRALAWWHHG